MIEKCSSIKANTDAKYMPGLKQMIRAYKTYPNCDKKRVCSCKNHPKTVL